MQALSTRFRLALVSNGPGDLQRIKLAAADLSGLFDRVIISGEVGVAKPRPRIFMLALESLGCAPHWALMIGDDWRNDVEGATAAGVKTIFVDRDRVDGPRRTGPRRRDGDGTVLRRRAGAADELAT